MKSAKRMKITLFGVFSLLPLLCLQSANAAVVLVHDQFNDTDRIGGQSGSSTSSSSPTINTPTSTNTQWVSNAASRLVASSSGMLWDTTPSSNRMILGYFPKVNIAQGLTTTFQLTFTTGDFGAEDDNIRIALVGGGAQRETDGFGSSDNSYGNAQGYGIWSASGNVGIDGSGNLSLRTFKRTTINNNLLGSAGDWTRLDSGNRPDGNINENTTYTLSIDFDYDGEELHITTSLSGGAFENYSYTATDTDPYLFEEDGIFFDTIAFRLGTGNQFADINFTEFKITQIPEPSTYAALFGLLALGFIAWSKKRRIVVK